MLQDGKQALQCNEGRWDFTLQEDANGSAVVLEVEVGRFLDSSLIMADVQPRLVRLLIKVRTTGWLAYWPAVCVSQASRS